MATTATSNVLTVWLPRILGWLSRLVAWSAARMVRLILLAVTWLFILWLLYGRAWLPLTAELELPPGVTPQNPTLNTELLQSINSQRVERVETTQPSFQTDQLFALPRQVISP